MSDGSGVLQGLKIFVVEDEALVALNLEDILGELGCTVIGPALRLGAASEMMNDTFHADVAILDVNVAGEPVFPVAEKLVGKGIPVIFATGYGQAGLPDTWHSHTILQKPYAMDDVVESLARVTGRN
ncbi:response regulator [Aliihoeflea sp. PC F10.4]